MFFIVHHDSASISSCETQFCQRINADWSCVHGLGRTKLRARGEMPLALGTPLFLATVMDLLVLERAPWEQLGTVSGHDGVSSLFSVATENSTLGTPEEFQEVVYRDPGKLPCIFGLLRGNANAKFKFYKSWTRRGRNSQSHLKLIRPRKGGECQRRRGVS